MTLQQGDSEVAHRDHGSNTRETVAFQGEHGAFSEDAARKLLGKEIRTLPCRSFEEMFEAAVNGKAEYAIAPIENSLAGSVHKNYDLLLEHDLTIAAETSLRIVHNLIAPVGVRLSDVKKVYSHPVALAQCERFLRAHPEIEATAVYDTAGSVKMVVEGGRRDEAGIAAASAAATYSASILIEGIEDNSKNFTRFLLLTRPGRLASSAGADPAATQDRKTSVVFRIGNKPGALFRALGVFALRDIDLLKIESRPIEGRPWEYSFYLDLAGDSRQLNVGHALGHLAEITESLKVLGSYIRSK
jgi:prephenate dehydratase